MRSLRLILNGKAAQEGEVRTAVAALRNRGHSVDVRVTWEAGQAALFAQEAAAAGVDVVVAAGGDGTANEVAGGLLRTEPTLTGHRTLPALGLLPLGTGNDLARSIGLPLEDPTAALTLAAEGPIHAIDVGLVNDLPLLNVASGGFGAEVTANTPPEWKEALGSAAYSLAGLLSAGNLRPHACRLEAAGQALELSIALLAVGNGRHAGGGFAVAPEARLDDGLLDLTIVPAVPLADLPALVGELFQVADEGNQHVLYWQLPAFELHFADEFPLNRDGEPMAGRHFRFIVLPRRLPVVVPAGFNAG
jgi:lipid kinase YegS